MTEIPEHLLKRAQAARDKAADDAATPAAAAGDSRIPDHLLERSKAARADGGAVAVADKLLNHLMFACTHTLQRMLKMMISPLPRLAADPLNT